MRNLYPAPYRKVPLADPINYELANSQLVQGKCLHIQTLVYYYYCYANTDVWYPPMSNGCLLHKLELMMRSSSTSLTAVYV